ncbi:glycosyltransferase [Lachnospira pectinoschiza]|uniref:Lipopolysaccharide biosynthesis protein, LPS:glycosyltransferase n=1 Tax=Lachnospira pectinoschiza TaxID=28052 RepID=A0A1G9TY57_9FIRM|nr:glycosyltransferase [Lachnospira pectinoschiza]SDM52606.1 Lipopolysaccharide biosynthesis protein, LPS:glycosyltransferase [Lachnospira pectinoschiza]
MNILYCGDRKMERGLLMSTISLLDNSTEPLNIYVLTLELTMAGKQYKAVSNAFIDFLSEYIHQRREGSTIKKIDVSKFFEKEKPEANLGTRFTPCCMLRLYADEIEEIPDRILYLDTDVLAKKDFSEFYHQNIDNYEFAGVLDYYGKHFFRRKPKILKFDYFNSGVLLLNMTKIRETGLFKKSRMRCISKQMLMPDQSSLNKLAIAKKKCERKYNDQRRDHSDTVFRHFTTTFRFFPKFRQVTVKPWDIDKVHEVLKLHDYDELFENYNSLLSEYQSRKINDNCIKGKGL